jgi:putative flippase GtrA
VPDPGARTDRWRKLTHEVAKFGVVGGANTVINFVVFNALVLTVLQHGQLKANVVATVVATTASYFMNRHWTYRDRPKSALRREYTLFFLFNAAGLVIELAVLGAAKYGLGLTSLIALNIAKFGGLALGTAFRFWSYRTFVFRPVPSAARTPAPARPATAPVGAAPTTAAPTMDEDFAELTAPLEVELDGPLAADLAAELARADMLASRRAQDG